MTRAKVSVGITGLGWMLPAGASSDSVHTALSRGESLLQPAPVFGVDGPLFSAGQVPEEAVADVVPRRSRRKLDRGTVFAVAAIDGAATQAGLSLISDERDRIGLVIGNCTGGWGYVEQSMYGLYGTGGMNEVNPYVATAWFPAAAQGEYSIFKGLRGISKTLSCGRSSGGAALDWAARWIRLGRCDAVVAGGSEAPLNALVHNAFLGDGVLSPSQRYRPFTSDADGALLGEGAAMCCLEAEAAARARGAQLLAQLSGSGLGRTLQGAIRSCLADAGVSPDDVDYVILDADGRTTYDVAEYQALADIFGGVAGLKLSAPKTMYGQLLGAGMAADVAVAVLSLSRQCVYPTARGVEVEMPPVGRHVLEYEQTRVSRVLVLGRDMDGRALALLLGRAQLH
jgi:3-oxoacyl-(acyl-carrier-protein) synthase